MISDLERLAFRDLTRSFWNKRNGNFSFSSLEKISSPSITAVCTMAIKNYESDKPNWLTERKPQIEKYFVNSYPWMDAGKHYKNTMAMSFGYLGLKALDSKNDNICNETLEYLEDQQNPDGGWFFSNEIDDQSNPYFTYWALKCFLNENANDSHWSKIVMPTFYYLMNSIKKFNAYPTTYNLIRKGLYDIEKKYKDFMTDEELNQFNNLYEYKIGRFQNKDGSWKHEPAIINSAYFRKSLFSLKNLYLLSSRGYKVISNIYSNMFDWIKNNHLKPGWPSDSERMTHGLSWTTAYVLMGLTEYKKAINQYLS